ncbi:Aspartate aminotransferase family protein OS=Rhodanobacter lindaniclasticus OX=75310 GN=B1991_05380 PE=3 SV=1 [Rhodanobacter lindaniclasticus]
MVLGGRLQLPGNKRLNDVLKRQIDLLPQVASQYLHQTRIELAETVALDAKKKFGLDGRVHFNVGGAQAIEDSLKLVRELRAQSLMFAFEGGYHGRTLGASSITSSYRYRRRFGHFGERAMFLPFPYPFRRRQGHERGRVFRQLRAPVRASVRDRIQRRVGPEDQPRVEYAAFYVEPGSRAPAVT